MKKILFSLIFVCGLFVLFIYQITQAPKNTNFPKQIEYNENEPLTLFIQKLKNEGIIKNADIFKIIFVVQGFDRSIKPGVYTFSEASTLFETIEKITSDSYQTKGIRVVIPEGSTTRDITNILNTAFKGKQTFNINESYEGFLFPDTYFFSANSTEQDVIKKLQSTWKTKTEALFQNKSDQEIRDTIIMASILEKEGKTKNEREIIAGILWKRLREDIPLQVDATFLYTHNKGSSELSLTDLQTDNPYNTYKRKGLPVGPINNPGLETLRAALNPKESPYYFYLHDSRGQIYYAKTFEEHKKNKALYLK